MSDARTTTFFVAPGGRADPKAELHATLRGFFSPSKRTLIGQDLPAQSVQCQFPARWRWLNQELALEAEVPRETCPKFDEFRVRAAATKATIVFSSYDLGVPSSVYGHSLLRLGSEKASGTHRQELLDWGINYAANPTTTSPILYAVLGLAGGFDGNFAMLPYYHKVREYSDFEARDLWEYELSLSEQEVEQLVAHVWELASTSFTYFYLTSNCSYQLLALLEAAAPRLNLLQHVHAYVIPVDTLKALFTEAGLVKSIHYRPSLKTQFFARAGQLTGDEREELSTLVGTPWRPPAARPDLPSQARLADAQIDAFDLAFARELLEKQPEPVERKRALLIGRSRLPTAEPLQIPMPAQDAPHLSHDSTRVGVAQAWSRESGAATDFALRFALHDLSDLQRGLPRQAVVTMAALELRYWEGSQQRLRLENATLFDVEAYQPLRRFERAWSWRVSAEADRIYDPRCHDCLATLVRGGAGGSVEWFLRPGLLTYLFFDVEPAVSTGFSGDFFSSGLGPSLGARLLLWENLSLLGELQYRRFLNSPTFDDSRLRAQIRWSFSKSWSVAVRYLGTSYDQETTAGASFYY